MKTVITQPNFLPWLGYLDRMQIADNFVLLDSVQHVKRSWQFRNRIINRQGETQYIGINTVKAKRDKKLSEIEISEEFKTNKISNVLKNAYRGVKRFELGLEEINKIIDLKAISNFSYVDYIENHLNNISRIFGINLKIIRASNLKPRAIESNASEYILQICEELNTTEYITAIGSRSYMENQLSIFSNKKIKVSFHDLREDSYIQEKFFYPRLSFVDFLMYKNPNDLSEYLNKNRILENI